MSFRHIPGRSLGGVAWRRSAAVDLSVKDGLEGGEAVVYEGVQGAADACAR